MSHWWAECFILGITWPDMVSSMMITEVIDLCLKSVASTTHVELHYLAFKEWTWWTDASTACPPQTRSICPLWLPSFYILEASPRLTRDTWDSHHWCTWVHPSKRKGTMLGRTVRVLRLNFVLETCDCDDAEYVEKVFTSFLGMPEIPERFDDEYNPLIWFHYK